jgi:hypothetical protein
MKIKHLVLAVVPVALVAIAVTAGTASASCSTYNGAAYCSTDRPNPAPVNPALGPISSWNGQYSGSPTASHCDNIGDATYLADHNTGAQPGASDYHVDPGVGNSTSCGGVEVGIFTGWITVAGNCAPNCNAARNNDPSATLGGGGYVGVPAAGVGAGIQWVPLS